MSYSGKSPNVNRLRLNPRSADPTNPTEGDLQYADGSAREEGVWVYKNGAWTQVASASSSGINYVTDGNGESGQTTNWATYADAAAAVPVDGTGGSPNVTFAVTSTASEVLRGSRSLKLVKDAANRQGQGVANTITIDRQDYEASKNLFLTFDYKTTANFASGDIRCFVYDITNAIVYNVQSLTSAGSVNASTTATRFVGSFQSVAASTQYRVIWHIATTNASAYDLILDNVRVSPDAEVPGAFVADLGTQAWTVANATATSSIRLARVGNRIFAEGTIDFTGAASGTIGLTIPAAYAPSSSDYSQLGSNNIILGGAKFVDTGSGTTDGSVQLTSASNLSFIAENSSGTYLSSSNTSSTVPHTWASTDKITFQASWIVSGWAAAAAMSTTENLLANAKVVATRSSSQQSFTSGATTTIVFDSETRDAIASYNPSTGEFTAPRTGWYLVSSNVYIDTQTALATNERLILYAYVNGSHAKTLGIMGSGSQTQTGVEGCSLLYLNSGDVLTVRVFQDSGSSLSTFASANYTNLSILECPDFSIFSVYGQTEYQESKNSSPVAWPFSATTYGDHTSLLLQPGEYDLTGVVEYSNSAAVSAGFNVLGISTTSGNSGAGLSTGDSRSMSWNVGTSGLFQTHVVANYRVVVTTPTTYYLKGYYGNTITNLQREGYKLSARRVK